MAKKKKTVRKKAAGKKTAGKRAKKAASKAAKRTKKTVRKAARKTARKASGAARATKKKAARGKKKAKKKVSRSAMPKSPRAVSTGSGPGPAEIGADVFAMFNARVPDSEIWDKWFSPKLVSIEGDGRAWHGMAAVRAKNDEFMESHTIHGARAEALYCGSTGFAIRYVVDMEVKATGQRAENAEIGIYTVKNGKVVQEEFMYGA